MRIGEGLDVLVADLAARLTPLLGLPVVVEATAVDPGDAFVRSRGQYDSRRLMAAIEGFARDDDAVLGVADVDLFASVFTFVFGEAHLGGRVGLVSAHRLRPERYGLEADAERVALRLLTEAVHELGHLRGAVHCGTPGCVMNFSGAVEEIDLKGPRPCPACAPVVGVEAAPVAF